MKLPEMPDGAAQAVARDVIGVAGLGLIVAGIDVFSRGLAMIVAGVMLVAVAVLLARR